MVAGTLNDPQNLSIVVGIRPDRNRWVDLESTVKHLPDMRWGSSQGTDTQFNVLQTFDTPITPTGYWRGALSDTVSEFGNNLATDAQTNVGNADNAVPFFTGPDGVSNTTDDLPIGPGPDGFAGFTVLVVPPGSSCRDALGTGVEGGVNGNGDCIRINVIQTAVPTGGGGFVAAITDDDRPQSAFVETQDLTGYRAGALPARPRNPDSQGLYYRTAGFTKAFRDHDSLVSNLDVDFREDELKWGHGASQDEHEFREGYLEFEMFDSQLFARVGKLIMVWGKTELFRNQDRLNPTDIGIVTLSSLEESRIGQWAADVTWYWGYVGPIEDVRTEFVLLVDDFEPTDLGKCGEPFVFLPVCGKSFGPMASGMVGLGLIGEARPDDPWDDLSGLEVAFRVEGRWDRFTFAITDYYGYDDSFVLDVVTQYGRRVDPQTGAPVRSEGALSCETAPGGPNGIVGDADDTVPFVGNCLLFNSDGTRRAPEEVALHQASNQTLFHTACSLTFDQDSGGCPFDTLNNNTLLEPTALVLGGSDLSTVAILGFDTIRTNKAPSPGDPENVALRTSKYQTLDSSAVTTELFGQIGDPANPSLGNLTDDQKALLGCGKAFGSGCDNDEAQDLVRLGILDEAAGGVDFMNSDASVVTQDWMILKAASSGALVGTRIDGIRGSYFEAGITAPAMVDLNNDGVAETPFNPSVASHIRDTGSDPLTDTGVRLSEFAGDYSIEPYKYEVDERLLEEFGIVQFKPSWGIDPNDPTDDDLFLVPGGENCSQAFGLVDPTCTELEIFSANLERLLITNEQVGSDDVFDPPESVEELVAMLNVDERDDFFGDPLSGPDGIFYRNADVDADGVQDVRTIQMKRENDTFLYDTRRVEDPANCPAVGFCWLDISDGLINSGEIDATDVTDPTDPAAVRFVDALPIQVNATDSDTGERIQVDPHEFDGVEIQLLGDGQTIPYDSDGDGAADRNIAFTRQTIRGMFSSTAGEFQDLDLNRVPDLDEDRDGGLDYVDDATFDAVGNVLQPSYGPISDDNILCGSGIPGDPLNEAVQHEFANDAWAASLAEVFPTFGGLPPRSPVFCSSLTGLLGVSGFTLPAKRAGGDGRFGRRDFLWHGGQQVMIDYQKKNVFGFSLDFAEDVTKTSWGFEFSWTSGKLFGDTLVFGNTRSDEYVLSLSMDRPTFINFLNPNRTFFINVQFFLKYFSDYHGGDRRGMYGTSDGPFDARFVVFFFTGYFQDRLTPRVTFVYDPPTSSGGVLTSLSYRVSDKFLIQTGLNSFFGHVSQIESSFFPISLLTRPDATAEVSRGISPARNRDEIFLILRYTF
jgi:hypothetical protein